MPPRFSPPSTNLTRAPIEDVIKGAKNGSLDDLEALAPHIRESYAKHSTAILDALLPHLKVHSGLDPYLMDTGMGSMCAMFEVNWWLTGHPARTPLTIATSLRLFSASNDYISWAHEFMRVTSSADDTEAILGGYQITTMFFHSLFATPKRIVPTLATRGDMLDLAIRWWIGVCDGFPILYAEGIHNPKAIQDCGIAVFCELTKENSGGMAEAIMDGRICDPQEFVEQTMDRARCLVRMNRIGYLSHFPDVTPLHTKENLRGIFDITCLLRRTSPELRRLFKKARVLDVFMEVLEQIRQAVPDRPGRPEDSEKGRAEGMLELLALLVDWVVCTPSDMIDNLQMVVERGFLALLGDCVRFAHGKGSRFTSVTAYLIAYATYPKVLTALLPRLAVDLIPKIVHLKSGSTTRAYLQGLASGLEPLRKKNPQGSQDSLCDSLTHSRCAGNNGVSTSEKVCAGCHTVAYCSKECQIEDWKALHRDECAEMRKKYFEGKSVRGHYAYRYRKYHASVTRMCYETNEVVRRTIAYTQDKWHDYDPTGVCQSIIILPEDQDSAPGWVDGLDAYLSRTTAQGVMPPYLQPRFGAFVDIFRRSISAARRKPSTPLRLRKGPGRFDIPNDCPGSIRFAERAFRWGEREQVSVLLMEQIKDVPIFTAPSLIMAEVKALQATRQDTHGGPIFKIHASLVYECPSRSFSSADLVVAGQ